MLTLKMKLPVILPGERGLFGNSRELQLEKSKLQQTTAKADQQREDRSFIEEAVGSWGKLP